ncbi:MAG: YbfB/YjiJ family MFS transporter [Candidatus Accumulibacter phosphatis]|uniref:YbfB/YjiJ family MFS transporter n=1 Tax=Candidatus Accumulibacter cognatus TaxID=2954383 RepID=A0A7D5N995_9PROT|nr:YbfB/YjiJ family MFS transporter [Candidatus Accumulibacter phosphatis]QLH49346.1 MAG: YbfB/YjiJ family MFS transporter [Candidatus Accumulibacter cognatus]
MNTGRNTPTYGIPLSLLVILSLSLGPAIANGFARFAYALLLPSMRDAFGWSYSTAGSLNTANGIGYILGALAVFFVVGRLGNRRLYIAGIVLTSLSLVATGFCNSLPALMFWRFVAGVVGAAVFICGSALVSAQGALHSRVQPFAIPGYFGGAGIGMLLSGIGIPVVLEWQGQGAWREAWVAMGALALVFSLFSVAAALNSHDPSGASVAGRWNWRDFSLGVLAYFVYGGGYITYMTFIIAWMRSHQAGVLQIAGFWGLLGLAVMASPYVWKTRLARNRGGNSLGLVCAVLAVAAFLPYVDASSPTMTVSALLFGVSMFIGPAAITVMVRNGSPQGAWGAGIAAFTTAFGIGQAAGPVFSGWLGDLTGSLSLPIASSAAILAAASAIAYLQKDVRWAEPARANAASGQPTMATHPSEEAA